MSGAGTSNTFAQNKKRKGTGTDFTEKQSEKLEEEFAKNQNPDQTVIFEFLSSNKREFQDITAAHVEVWYAKRRTREREPMEKVRSAVKPAKKSNAVANALRKRNEKEKNGRVVFTKEVLEELNKLYTENQYPGVYEVKELIRNTGLAKKQVHKWFQNRRQHQKRQAHRNGKQATKSNAASNVTQEMEANAELTAANKENTSENVSEMRKEVSEK